MIFSGIQPTGVPHLGNYLGALRSWVRLQEEAWSSSSVEGGRQTQQQKEGEEGREDDGQGEPPLLLYSVVDLHALTVPQDAKVLRRQRREMLAALLAVGLDPRRSTVFYQSSVSLSVPVRWWRSEQESERVGPRLCVCGCGSWSGSLLPSPEWDGDERRDERADLTGRACSGGF